MCATCSESVTKNCGVTPAIASPFASNAMIAERRRRADAVAHHVARTTTDGDGSCSSEIDAGALRRRHVDARDRRRCAATSDQRLCTNGDVHPSRSSEMLRQRAIRQRRRIVRRAQHDRLPRRERVDRRRRARHRHVQYQSARQLFPHVRGHALRRRIARLDHRQQNAVEHEPGIRRRAPRECRAESASSSAARAARTAAARARAGCTRARDARPGRAPAACRRSTVYPRSRARSNSSAVRGESARSRMILVVRRRSRSRCRPRPRAAREGSSCARPRASRACRRDSPTDRRASCAALRPSPKRTEPCGSASMSSVFVPAPSERGREIDRRRRLADAALLADDREDVSHASARISSASASPLRSVRRASLRRAGPSAPTSAPDGGLARNASRCFSAPVAIAALEQQKREPVVRAGQLGIELERALVAADRLFGPIRLA